MHGGEVFIPKIPSFGITHLVHAFGCEPEIVGIRPGEKLHEALVGPDEARNCWDCGDTYVLARSNPEHGRPIMDGFTYTSDGNDVWLDVPTLKERIAAL